VGPQVQKCMVGLLEVGGLHNRADCRIQGEQDRLLGIDGRA